VQLFTSVLHLEREFKEDVKMIVKFIGNVNTFNRLKAKAQTLRVPVSGQIRR
jgi:hypothetical protein